MQFFTSSKPARRSPRSETGMAYVAILVLLALVTTLGTAIITRLGTGSATGSSYAATMKATYLAEAAVNHALWRLLNEEAFPAATDRYYMHSLAGGRYGYKVRRHTVTTFATIAAVGVFDGIVVRQSHVLYLKGSSVVTDMLTVYGSAAGIIPRYRLFNGVDWNEEQETVLLGLNETRWMVTAGHPSTQEHVMGELNDDNDINLAVWDGSAWGHRLLFTETASRDLPCFDVVYEQNTGRALVIGRADNTGTPRYTLWDGSTWLHDPPAAAPALASKACNVVAAASCPDSDEILVAIVDDDADIYVLRWDGLAFSSLGLIETDAAAKDRDIVDVVYERLSRRALVIWGRNNALGPTYRIWDGSVLGPEGNLPSIGKEPRMIRAAADRRSDYICVTVMDTDKDLHAMIWGGGSWVDSQEIEIEGRSDSRRCFDVAWRSSGSGLLIAWSRNGSDFLHYKVWSKGSALSSTSSLDGPSFLDDIELLRMLPVTGQDEIAILGIDSGKWLRHTLWNGVSFAPSPAEQLSAVNITDRMAFAMSRAGQAALLAGVGTPLLAVETTITLNDEALVDSYDSNKGAYGGDNIGTEAVVSSNTALGNPIGILGTSRVLGHVLCGPTGDPDAAIAVAAGALVTGLRAALEEAVTIAKVTPPDMGASEGNFAVSSGTFTWNSDHYYDSITIGGTAVVEVSADIIVRAGNKVTVGDSAELRVVAGGGLTLYAEHAVALTGAANVYSTDGGPARIVLKMSGVKSLTVMDMAQLHATITGQRAVLTVADDAQLYGTFRGGSVGLAGNAQLHLDTR